MSAEQPPSLPWRHSGTAETDGYRIDVETLFIPERSVPNSGTWLYAYRITITNVSGQTATLTQRHWRITDAMGRAEQVDGPGVVGEHPTLAAGEGFQYTSYCPLPTEFGSMTGHYDMETDDGQSFAIQIPEFALIQPGSVN